MRSAVVLPHPDGPNRQVTRDRSSAKAQTGDDLDARRAAPPRLAVDRDVKKRRNRQRRA